MSAVAAIQAAWLTRGAAERVESCRRAGAGARRAEERQAALRAVRQLASIRFEEMRETGEWQERELLEIERGKSKERRDAGAGSLPATYCTMADPIDILM